MNIQPLDLDQFDGHTPGPWHVEKEDVLPADQTGGNMSKCPHCKAPAIRTVEPHVERRLNPNYSEFPNGSFRHHTNPEMPRD